jgi:hypothetical protein
MSIIKAMPNQSLLDIINQGCGSMEAGMQFCMDNNTAISDYPDVGKVYSVSSQALNIGDAGVLKYLAQNGIVLGTLGVVPVLGFSVVLKPVMEAVPTDPNPPSVSGFYSYNLQANTASFINVNSIAAGDYPTNNTVTYETEDRVIAGYTPDTTAENASSLVMSSKVIPYKIPWDPYRGFMMIWSDLGATAKTATFVDTAGNQAYVSPMVVLDSSTQDVEEYLIADLVVELVSAGYNTLQLRLIRSHAPVIHADFVNQVMTWLHDAAGGTPDPLDPTNADKTIVTLSRGTYTLGVGTVYWNGTIPYPASAFSMVVVVS